MVGFIEKVKLRNTQHMEHSNRRKLQTHTKHSNFLLNGKLKKNKQQNSTGI